MDAATSSTANEQPSPPNGPPIDVVACAMDLAQDMSDKVTTAASAIYANTFEEEPPRNPSVGEKLDSKIAAVKESAQAARENIETFVAAARDNAETAISATRDNAEAAVSATRDSTAKSKK